MAQLDVIVINADTFEKAALVQIAGRVGRKQEAPTGMVLFIHEGVSISMLMAKKDITRMNKLGFKEGGSMNKCIQCATSIHEELSIFNFYKPPQQFVKHAQNNGKPLNLILMIKRCTRCLNYKIKASDECLDCKCLNQQFTQCHNCIVNINMME